MAQATFYFDLGSPFAYLTAERISEVLPKPAVRHGVARAPCQAAGRSSSAMASPRAVRRGWSRWSAARACTDSRQCAGRSWPTDYLYAMASTYAFHRVEEFTMQAFRHAFNTATILPSTSTSYRPPRTLGWTAHAVNEAVSDPEVELALRTATDAAHTLGVFGVPTIAVADELFWGDDRLEDAAGLPPRRSRERQPPSIRFTVPRSPAPPRRSPQGDRRAACARHGPSSGVSGAAHRELAAMYRLDQLVAVRPGSRRSAP